MSIKSELNKTAEYLRNARTAIVGRGGEINTTAGMKDLADAIINIPHDATLAYQEVENTSYQSTVPANVESMSMITKIGGMTYKSNNLIPYPYTNTSKTDNGITWTVNADGSVTANGTANKASYFFFVENEVNTTTPYDMILSGCPSGGGYDRFQIHVWREGLTIIDDGASVKVPKGTEYKEIYAVIRQGYTANNLTFKPMLNAGTTALPYEPFFEGLRNAAVEEAKSEGADGTLDTLSVPQAVQELDGYGVGINADYYNLVDFTTKKFFKKVGRVDLETLAWRAVGSYWLTNNTLSDAKMPIDNGVKCNIISEKYETRSASGVNTTAPSIGLQSDGLLQVYAGEGVTPSGLLYYELAEEIATDISELLPPDNLIKVEAGGTITAVNEHKLDVPTKITYLVQTVGG